MPCLSPNKDFSVLLEEDLLNFVLSRFYDARPQLFHRISSGMDGVQVYDNPQPPFKIGDTGHFLEYELQFLKPSDGRFIVLFPADGFPFPVGQDQFVIQGAVRTRLWDPKAARRFQFELAVCLLGRAVIRSEAGTLSVIAVSLGPMSPPGLEQSLEYALRRMLESALRRLAIPVNFLAGPPTNLRLSIDLLDINNKQFIARGSAGF